jgi:hypothetical protein
MSEQEKDFLDISTITQLHNFLNKYYFSQIDDDGIKNCIKLYTSKLGELKTMYEREFGKKAPMNMNSVSKIKIALQTKETYNSCDEPTFKLICWQIINNNIPDSSLLQWLEKNGGYENSDLFHDSLVEEFFQRLNKYYYRPIPVENKVCGIDLSPFRERVATVNKGIYANVLSVPKILSQGGLELLNNVVYCISETFGMSNLELNIDGTIKLSDISKQYHSIKETINVNDDEKLVLYFNWNKNIIFCEGFQIKEISPGNNDIDFTTMTKGLYNYILVCFQKGSEKKYRLYMAEAQPLEIGSKHWNIITKVNIDFLSDMEEDSKIVIITAGEIDLTEENLVFNFFSGTIFTKILQGECEVITGLKYEEYTEERCHNVIYDYFLAPYMMELFQGCNAREDFSFYYTNNHLIDPKSLRENGIIFDQEYYNKLQKLESTGCDITFEKLK